MLVRRLPILILLLKDERLALFLLIFILRLLTLVLAKLYALLSVVPRTARVTKAKGDLNAADDDARQQTVKGVLTKEDSDDAGCDNDEGTGGKHVLQRGLRRDSYTPTGIGRLALLHLDELRLNLLDHLIGRVANS